MKYWLILLLVTMIVVAAAAEDTETVRVGAYNNPPKIFTTADGRTAGIFPDILAEIAQRKGWKIDYIRGTWEQCLDRLRTGDIDLMVDVAKSSEREERFTFSRVPVLVNWGTAYVRPDITVQSFLDMEGKTIAVMRGSIHSDGTQGIKQLTAKFGVSCHFIEVDNYHDVLMLVDAKEADVGIVNRLFGTLYADDYDVSSTPVIFNPRILLFAAPKTSERGRRLLTDIDASLRAMKQTTNSVYDQALAYYLGGGTQRWMHEDQLALRELNLTPEEIEWLNEHPVIRYSVDPGFAPFEFVTDDDEFKGMAADYLTLLARRTGLLFKRVRQKTWSESVAAMKAGKIDLLPCIGMSEAREEFIAYSQPYLKFARVIITPVDSPIVELEDLHRYTVGVQVDSSHHAFLREQTTIDPRLFPTFEETLLAVSRGDIDAAIGNLAVTTHTMRNLSITNIKLAGYASQKPQALCLGIRDDWTELKSILNKALDAVTAQQHNAILAKWLPLPRAPTNNLDLSQKEREWLLMHPRIRVAWKTGWAPIEFADARGQSRGISIDYLNAIADSLGVRFDMVAVNDCQEVDTCLEQRDADMSCCLTTTPKRLKSMDFTETYMTAPVVYFARENMPYIRGVSELRDFRVSVVKDDAVEDWLRRDHPALTLIRAPSLTAAFEGLHRGKTDVVVCSAVSGNYYISKLRYNDIKIAGEAPYTYKLRMAVRNDWPVLTGILKKALAAIPETDKTAFYRNWVWLKYEHGFDYSLLAKIVSGALVVILVFFYWNRRLAAEINHRKEVEKALSQNKEELRARCADLKKMKNLKDNLIHMVIHDMRTPLTTISGCFDIARDPRQEEKRGTMPDNLLDMASASADELNRMIQSLLDINRLEANKMPVNRTATDLRETAENAARTMQLQARLTGRRICLTGESSTGYMDPELIRRVLVNLIGNALKASPKGETVHIHTSDAEKHMACEVHDAGPGIPPDMEDRIFDKFATVERTGEKGSASVGLGLAFCKLAVEAHGGTIEVENHTGNGCTFRLTLPKTVSKTTPGSSNGQ